MSQIIRRGYCHECREVGQAVRTDVVLAERKVGGGYNRAHRIAYVLICRAHAESVVAYDDSRDDYVRSYRRWMVSSVRRALRDFDAGRRAE